MKSCNPEQPNAPPVEEMTDEELLALRERCSRELGRRGMSETNSVPTPSRQETSERRAQKKTQKSGLKQLKKAGRYGVVRASSAESSGVWKKRAYAR